MSERDVARGFSTADSVEEAIRKSMGQGEAANGYVIKCGGLYVSRRDCEGVDLRIFPPFASFDRDVADQVARWMRMCGLPAEVMRGGAQR